MLIDLQQLEEGPTVCDNKSTISMTKNSTFHNRIKHIDIRHYFILEIVAKEEIFVKYCTTDEQVADALTKSLSKEKFNYSRILLGVRNSESMEAIGE